MVEIIIALNDNLQLAVGKDPDPARMFGTQRNHYRLTRDSQRLDDFEDALDLLERYCLEQERFLSI
ncbi:MAG: hypothetical protein ACLQU2_27070 [Candidatus Binataceae bacterium]